MSPFGSQRTPAEWEDLVARIDAFMDAYVEFLNDTLEDSYRGLPAADTPQRRRIIELGVRAEKAVNAVGVKVGVAPPPVFAGQNPKFGLTQVALAHESEVFRESSLTSQPGSHDLALDTAQQVRAELIDRRDAELRRRRQPFYWPDRALRAILGFPAYLLSLVLGFDLQDVKPKTGRLLWLVSVVADLVLSLIHI